MADSGEVEDWVPPEVTAEAAKGTSPDRRERERPKRRERPEFKHRPRDIQLSEEQTKSIEAKRAEIEKLKLIKRPEDPTRGFSERSRYKDEIDRRFTEIRKLDAEIAQMDDEWRRQEAIRRGEVPPKGSASTQYEENRRRIKEMIPERDKLHASVGEKIGALRALQEERGIKSLPGAQRQIERIEEDIERKTLTHAEVSKRLTELQHLKQVIAPLEVLQKQIDEMREREEELNGNIASLVESNKEISGVKNEEDAVRKAEDDKRGALYSQHQKARDDLRSKSAELRAQNEALRNERKQKQAEINASFDEFKKAQKRIDELQEEVDKILLEADQAMTAAEEARAASSPAARNPFYAKLVAGRDLMLFLNGLLATAEPEPEAAAPAPKDDLEGWGAIAKRPAIGGKKQAKRAKVEVPKEIALDLRILGEFAEVGLTAPHVRSEIPAVLQKLAPLVKEWEAAEAPLPAPAASVPAAATA